MSAPELPAAIRKAQAALLPKQRPVESQSLSALADALHRREPPQEPKNREQNILFQ
jgi:hypothetical protein